MRLIFPILLLGCNATGSIVIDKVFDTGDSEIDDTDSESTDTGEEPSDSSETIDPEETDPDETDTQDTQDTEDTEPHDNESEDWQNNAEWSAYSEIERQGCGESAFYEYGTIYPNSPQEDWYNGCPNCNHIYANYAYYNGQAYAPCGIEELAPMYRGVDYIDTDGDDQTDEVDIYYWPTGDPYNPVLLGTAQSVILDNGIAAWQLSYTPETQGPDPDINSYFVFYNWY